MKLEEPRLVVFRYTQLRMELHHPPPYIYSFDLSYFNINGSEEKKREKRSLADLQVDDPAVGA